MNIRSFLSYCLFIWLSVSCFAIDSYQNDWQEEKNTYLKMGLGVSFSTKANVVVPLSFWDLSIQGYDSDLGVAPVFEIAFGHDIISFLTAEISLSYRPHYSYEKFQTPPNLTNAGPGSLGEKTRHFTIDATSLLFSFFIQGRGFSLLRWEMGPCGSYLYPFIAGGVGISELTIYDFRSTGLPPNPGFVVVNSFASENEYTKRYRFTYHVMAGLEYKLLPNWGFELGYRWFSVNRFRGPSFIRDSTGNTGDVRGLEWKQHLSAHEIFANVKYYF